MSQTLRYVDSWAAAWDFFKLRIRKYAIVHASMTSYKVGCEQRELLKRLDGLLKLECEYSGRFEANIVDVRGKLDACERQRCEGAAVRARTRACTLSDADSKTYFADERRHGRLSEVLELKVDDSVTADLAGILEAFHSHYRNIFGSSMQRGAEDGMAELFRLVPRLDAFERNLNNTPVSISDVANAIDVLAQGKTPGPHAIAAEFYKRFRGLLASYLLNVWNGSYSIGLLPLPSEQHTPSSSLSTLRVTSF